MRLLIADFDRQNIVSKHQVVSAVRRLPRSHYAGIRAIRYDPLRTLATAVSTLQNKPSSPHTDGFFYHEHEHGLCVIVLFCFRTPMEFHHILYHEIGHYVFLKVLDQERRDEWFFSVRRSEERFVSSRARQNAREDFAESYAFYCLRPARLATVPRKRDFLRDRVFDKKNLPPLSL
jgi:hypothetical protein